jgi:hypothetical protein
MGKASNLRQLLKSGGTLVMPDAIDKANRYLEGKSNKFCGMGKPIVTSMRPSGNRNQKKDF